MATQYRNFSMQIRLFKVLAGFWTLLLGATLVFAFILVPMKPAHALEPLPFPKANREIAAPSIFPFSVAAATTLPAQGLDAGRCQALLPSQRAIAGQSTKVSLDSIRHPAGLNDAKMVKVAAIKAYRQCRSQSALQELAMTWRWSW